MAEKNTCKEAIMDLDNFDVNIDSEFLGKNLVYGCIKLLEQWKLAISGICTKISIVIVDLHCALSGPADWWKV